MKDDVRPRPSALPRADAARPRRRSAGWGDTSALSRSSLVVSLALHGVLALTVAVWGLHVHAETVGGAVNLELATEQLVEAAEEEALTAAAVETPPVPDLPEPTFEEPPEERLPEEESLETGTTLEPLETPVPEVEIPLRVASLPSHRPPPPRVPPRAVRLPPRPPRPVSVASTPRRAAPTREGPIQALSTPIHYPPEALRRGVHGVVWLLVTITEDGRVTKASLHRSSGSAVLDDAALASVTAWRFARLPRERRALVPIEFVLGGLVSVR